MEDDGYSVDIGLHLSVNVVLLELICLLKHALPISQSTSEVHVLNAAKRNTPLISEILLVGVHDGGSRNDLLQSSSGGKVALKFLGDSLGGVILDGFDHQSKELIPLALAGFIPSSHH